MNKIVNMFSLKTFCVITGASKGLGKSIALKLASEFPNGSTIVLMARSANALAQTKECINSNQPNINVKCVSVDLTNQNSFDAVLSDTMKELSCSPSDFKQSFIVHNAGSLGDLKYLNEHNNLADIQNYWSLNLSSVIILTSAFHKLFTSNNMEQRVVLNISSICALQPFKSWSLYCAGKAARNMLMRNLAEEEPSIRVLSYSPGPLDTDMQVVARTESGDTQLRDAFKNMHESGQLLKPEDSVEKLMTLLRENKFENGAHIDIFDVK